MLETNQIYCGDSKELINNIEDNSIDLVVIDPPYKIRPKTSGNGSLAVAVQKYTGELERDNLTNEYDKTILNDLIRVMKKINIYIWCNGEQVPYYIDFFVKQNKCKMEILIWNKTNAMPLYSNRYLSDKEYCLYFRKKGFCQPKNYEDAKTIYLSTLNIKDKQKYGHPTIKPLPLIRKLIRNSSNENDVVLDCFIGSGTTAVASILENRKFIGFEINKKYYDIALKRISETNKEDDN